MRPTQPIDVYCVFTGPIEQVSVQRITNSLAAATVPSNNVREMHLLFHSAGGSVPDGVFLYNLFRAFPIDLTVYNGGSVQSVATIAYLGAKKRKASASATFLIHRTTGTVQATPASGLHAVADSVTLDDRRTEAILRSHIKLSDEQWSNFDKHQLVFSAEDAVRIGLAHEIGDFSPPAGTQIFNV